MAKDGINGLEDALKMMDALGVGAFEQADALFSANRTVLRKHVIKPAQTERPLFKTSFGIGKDDDDKLGILGGARVGGSVKSIDIGTRKKQKVTNKVLLWEEYGTDSRTTSRGKSTGVFPRNPFFRSIVAKAIRPIIKELNDDYGKLAMRYLKRKKLIKK